MDGNTRCIRVTSDNNRIMCIHYPGRGSGDDKPDEVEN